MLIICVVGRSVVRATFAADLAVVEKLTREQQPGHAESGKGESVDHLNAFQLNLNRMRIIGGKLARVYCMNRQRQSAY